VEARTVYGERRELFRRRLEEIGLPYFWPKGTFYLFADVTPWGMSSTEFCRSLLEESRVLVNPGSAFGHRGEGYVRVSLLAPGPRLVEALDRLEGFLQRHRV
jgi:aspartate/methionine/tyrosine aminotransferase